MTCNRPIHVGSVSYLNAKPLIEGLDRDSAIALHLDVPARLIDGLADGRFDVALLPVIDYQRLAGLRVIPSGGIGCDGPTLTVRIFSRIPIGSIRSLACDTHSHTSVALARVILHHVYGVTPAVTPWDAASHKGEAAPADAMLLIGDKVILDEPVDHPYQLDLGQAWKSMTGLPFVFAVWVARREVDLGDLAQRLTRARLDGMARVDQIVREYAVPLGWPTDIAKRYLTQHLEYAVTPRHLEAIRRFHQLVGGLGLVDIPVRELVIEA